MSEIVRYDHRDLVPLAQFAAYVGASTRTVIRWGAAGVDGVQIVRLSPNKIYILNPNAAARSRPEAEHALPGWSVSAVATALAVSSDTIANWARAGKFKLIRARGRHPLVERRSFTRWITARVQAGLAGGRL